MATTQRQLLSIMESLLQNTTALKALDVSVTTTQSPSPSHNVTTDWFKLLATERGSAVTQKDKCAGVAYVNTSQEFKSFTIVSRASEETDQAA